MAKAKAAAEAEGVALVPVVAGTPTPGMAWNLIGLTDERRTRPAMRVRLIRPGQQRERPPRLDEAWAS